MVRQHIYTKAKKGIYCSMPGYDTIAKSEGLSDSMVKTILHELCFYDIPFELKGEKDSLKYPQIRICCNTETDEMIIGNSRYGINMDNEEMNRFFVHNYIVTKQEKEEFIKVPEKIIYANGFSNIVDSDEIKMIEVNDIGIDEEENIFKVKNSVLSILAIDENTFKEILMGSFLSVPKNKKLFIILNVDSKEVSTYAKGILKYIYRGLPYEIRRKMGFVSYTKEPRVNPLLHIQFVSKEAFKGVSTSFNAGYLFDFYGRRFLYDNLRADKHSYLDFVWKNLDNKALLDNFMETADVLIDKNRMMLDEYDRLVPLFLVGTGNLKLPFKESTEVLKSLYEEMHVGDSAKNKYYSEYFFNIFEVEYNHKMEDVYTPSQEMIELIINFYEASEKFYDKEKGDKIKKKINSYILISLWEERTRENYEYVYNIFNKVSLNKEIFKNLIDNLFESEQLFEGLLRWYLNKRFEAANSYKALFSELKLLSSVSTKKYQVRYFYEEVEYNIMELLKNSENKIISLEELYVLIDDLMNLSTEDENLKLCKKYVSDMKKKIYENIIKNIDVTTLSKEDIMSLHLDVEAIKNDKCIVIKFLQAIIISTSDKELKMLEGDFKYFSDENIIIINNKIKEFLKKSVTKDNYRKIMTAFFIKNDTENVCNFNFDGIIKYIYDNGGMDKVREYIVWASDNLIELKEEQVKTSFKNGVNNYFYNYETEISKNKEVIAKFTNIHNKEIKDSIKQFIIENASGLKKLILKIKLK